jgi:hypothetical protein
VFLTVSYLELDRVSVNTVIKPLRAKINLNYICGPEKQKGVISILSYLKKLNFSQNFELGMQIFSSINIVPV